MRTMILSTAATLGLSALLFACEQPGQAEQQKEVQATNQAATAAQQAQNDQAAANRDAVLAQEEFAKSREDYLHTKRLDLINLDEKVFDLETKLQTATGKTRASLSSHLPDIRAERQDYVRNMEAMNDESGPAWDTAKANLDKEWDRLKAAVDSAS